MLPHDTLQLKLNKFWNLAIYLSVFFFLFPYFSSSIEKTPPSIFLFIVSLLLRFYTNHNVNHFFLFPYFSFFVSIHIGVGNLEYINVCVCVCVCSKLETKKNINWNVCVNIYFSYNMCVCIYILYIHTITLFIYVFWYHIICWYWIVVWYLILDSNRAIIWYHLYLKIKNHHIIKLLSEITIKVN